MPLHVLGVMAFIGFVLVSLSSAASLNFVKSGNVAVSGMWCPRDNDTAWAVWPADAAPNNTYPLLSFSHGMNGPSKWYWRMLDVVARSGYIIISHNSGSHGWCESADRDQAHVIDIAFASDTYPFSAINREAGVGVFGQSMGGHATMKNAQGRDSRIKAAVSFAQDQFSRKDISYYAKLVTIPIFYVIGTADDFVEPKEVFKQYNDTTESVDKVFVNVKGYDHGGLVRSPSFAYFTVAFFNCYLLGKTSGPSSCESIFGGSGDDCQLCDSSSNNVCPHNFQMQTCLVHKGSGPEGAPENQ